MTPAVIPAKGALFLRGVVTNVSQEEWTDINVAPFLSAEPITTRDELAEADAHGGRRDRRHPAQRPGHVRQDRQPPPRQVDDLRHQGAAGLDGHHRCTRRLLDRRARPRQQLRRPRPRGGRPRAHLHPAREPSSAGHRPPRRRLAAAAPARARPARRRRQPERAQPLGRAHRSRGPADPAGRVRRIRRLAPGDVGGRSRGARRARRLRPRQPAPLARAPATRSAVGQVAEPVGDALPDGHGEQRACRRRRHRPRPAAAGAGHAGPADLPQRRARPGTAGDALRRRRRRGGGARPPQPPHPCPVALRPPDEGARAGLGGGGGPAGRPVRPDPARRR